MWRLQNVAGPEQRVFMRCADEGHYAGRANTRQGIYACAPSGLFLGSLNSNFPAEVRRMLEQALARWERTPEQERWLSPEALRQKSTRLEGWYPAGGLVLKVVSRDLPRERPGPARDWRARAWNQDFAWFRKEEARRFLPEGEPPARGQRWPVPRELVERLARFHLVDNVRGQTNGYLREHVKRAALQAEALQVTGAAIEIRLAGETATEYQGRGVETFLLGRARWDRAKGRFAAFELVAVGERWGQTQFNFRQDDLDRAPIGFLFTLAGDTPAERVAPAEVYNYGWR